MRTRSENVKSLRDFLTSFPEADPMSAARKE